MIGYFLHLALIQLWTACIPHYTAGFLSCQHQLHIVLRLNVKLSVLPCQIDVKLSLRLLLQIIPMEFFPVQGQVNKIFLYPLLLHVFQINIGIINFLITAAWIIGIIPLDLSILNLYNAVSKEFGDRLLMRN